MTKEITKAIILQEMQDKLKLREFEPANFLFDETVVPTYDITQHLRDYVVEYVELSITSTGAKGFFIVPEDERWFLNMYNVVFMTGAFTIAGVYIGRLPALADFMYLDLAAAQSTSYAVILPKPVVLDSGEVIRINVDGYTTTGNLRLYIDYEMEKIR